MKNIKYVHLVITMILSMYLLVGGYFSGAPDVGFSSDADEKNVLAMKLFKKNQELEHRVASLEKMEKDQVNLNNNSVNLSVMARLDQQQISINRLNKILESFSSETVNDRQDLDLALIEMQEKELETYETNFDIKFDDLEKEVYREDVDPMWVEKMDEMFIDLGDRFLDLQLNETKIIKKDCRSSACVVEFLHKGVDSHAIVSLISVEGVELMTRQIEQGDLQKTVAIYKRLEVD